MEHALSWRVPMPSEKNPKEQPLPLGDQESVQNPEDSSPQPIEPYEPPELVKFERLEKLIVSGE